MADTGRLIVPELLDDAPESDASASLADLVRINSYLGGYRALRSLLAEVATPADGFSLLDVGAASGDMGARIRAWYPRAAVTSFDYKASHLAKARSPKIVGNAFQLPFAPRSFDFVFAALFLHHFEDDQVVELLGGFARLARRAVLVIDLERGPLAYHFLPWTRWLFRWHPITLHDGPVSVRAGFKKEELRHLAERAGLTNVRVGVHRPWARLTLASGCP